MGLFNPRYEPHETYSEETKIMVSMDNTKWEQIVLHPTGNFRGNVYPLSESVQGRYIKISQCSEKTDSTWVHATVYEFAVYDQYGKWGPSGVPSDYVNPHTMKDLLGVNGIWNWGGLSPQNYSILFPNARNYHNLRWDLDNPSKSLFFLSPKIKLSTLATGQLAKDPKAVRVVVL